MELAPNPRYSEAAKALEGSFKIVTLTPKTVKLMTQLLRDTKEWGHTNIWPVRNLTLAVGLRDLWGTRLTTD